MSRRTGDTPERQMWAGLGDAWTAVSTIFAGIGVWGAIGYGLDRLIGTWPVMFVIGAIAGNFGGIYLVYIKSLPRRSEAETETS